MYNLRFRGLHTVTPIPSRGFFPSIRRRASPFYRSMSATTRTEKTRKHLRQTLTQRKFLLSRVPRDPRQLTPITLPTTEEHWRSGLTYTKDNIEVPHMWNREALEVTSFQKTMHARAMIQRTQSTLRKLSFLRSTALINSAFLSPRLEAVYLELYPVPYTTGGPVVCLILS